MHASKTMVADLLKAYTQLDDESYANAINIVLFPPYVYLPQLAQTLAAANSSIQWGGQNLSEHKNGAYTGEISATMLKEFNSEYVLIGHSEPRKYYGESNERIAAKFSRALEGDLLPIVCMGETLSQYEQGQTEQIVAQQLAAILEIACKNNHLRELIIAYELVWAIGTGKTATPEQAQQVHAFIRQTIANHDQTLAKNAQILYGGCVKG